MDDDVQGRLELVAQGVGDGVVAVPEVQDDVGDAGAADRLAVHRGGDPALSVVGDRDRVRVVVALDRQGVPVDGDGAGAPAVFQDFQAGVEGSDPAASS